MTTLTHYRCVDNSKRSKSENDAMSVCFIAIQMQIIALEDPIDILLVRGRNRRPKNVMPWRYDVTQLSQLSWHMLSLVRTIVHSTF